MGNEKAGSGRCTGTIERLAVLQEHHGHGEREGVCQEACRDHREAGSTLRAGHGEQECGCREPLWDHREAAIGCRLLATDCWLLIAGCWLLSAGCFFCLEGHGAHGRSGFSFWPYKHCNQNLSVLRGKASAATAQERRRGKERQKRPAGGRQRVCLLAAGCWLLARRGHDPEQEEQEEGGKGIKQTTSHRGSQENATGIDKNSFCQSNS